MLVGAEEVDKCILFSADSILRHLVTFLDAVNSSYSLKMYINGHDVFGLLAEDFLVTKPILSSRVTRRKVSVSCVCFKLVMLDCVKDLQGFETKV